jgi:hypothetical protein
MFIKTYIMCILIAPIVIGIISLVIISLRKK